MAGLGRLEEGVGHRQTGRAAEVDEVLPVSVGGRVEGVAAHR